MDNRKPFKVENDRMEMRFVAAPRAQCAFREQSVRGELGAAALPVENFDLDRLHQAERHSPEEIASSEISSRTTEDDGSYQSYQWSEELPTFSARNADSGKLGQLELQPIRMQERAVATGAGINEGADTHVRAVTCTADGAEIPAYTEEKGVTNSASPSAHMAENYLESSGNRATASPATKTNVLAPSLPQAAAVRQWTDSTDEELGSGSSATAATAATGLSNSATDDAPGSPGMGLPSAHWSSHRPARASVCAAAPAEPLFSSLSIDSSAASSGAASLLRSGLCPISASNADAAAAASTTDVDAGAVAGADADADAELKTDFSSMDPAALEKLLNGPAEDALQFWEQQVDMVDRLLFRTISNRMRVFDSEVKALDNAEALWQELQAFANRSDSNA